MKQEAKGGLISPLMGILIGVNTIIGAGVFINMGVLTKAAGGYGFLGYILAFIALLPVALVISSFARIMPVPGGLYRYPREFVSPRIGFLSGWSYFLGKATTAALIIHTIVSFFVRKEFLPASIPIIVYDTAAVLLISLSNALGATIGGRVQWIFTFLKVIPFAGVLIGAAYYPLHAGGTVAPFLPLDFSQIRALIPLALFALSGFESICAVGHLLEAPQKNARFVIVGSAAIVALIATSFQLGLFIVLGDGLSSIYEPLAAFGQNVFNSPFFGQLMNYSAFLSVISGAYGYLVNNSWNIFALAQDDFFPGGKVLSHRNRNDIPVGGLAAQTLVIVFLLGVTREQIPLQNMAVFGTVFAYLLNVLAGLFARRAGKEQVAEWVAYLGIAVCAYIMYMCLMNIFEHGVSLSYLAIFMLGILVALGKRGLVFTQNAISKK
jgi:APA family basic amino acid/polyamine antiporter